jgi:threonine/homoserine/homoserine lactone efflux protein
VSVGVSRLAATRGPHIRMLSLRRRRTVPGVLVFLAASVALVAIPGPNVLFVLARGLSGGRRAAVISVLGVEAATSCFVAAAAFGLTALLVSSALAFAVVRYVGAAYLVFLAVRALRSGTSDPAPMPAGRTFRQAFTVGISNPKVGVFLLAFLPQFVTPGGSPTGQILLLGLVFLAVASTLDLGWALLAGVLGRWLRRHPAVLRRQRFVTAPIYLALAGYAGTS